MVWVTNAEYLDDFRIHIEFNDSLEGIIDFKPIIDHDQRAVIANLQEVELFKDFSLELDTVVWQNGADFAPEYLYDLVKKSKSAVS